MRLKNMKLKSLEDVLRAFTLDKLQALKTVVEAVEPTIDSGRIGEALGTASVSLGGVISSMTRTKIGSEPLVRVVTRTKERQRRLRYNEKIMSKRDMGVVINRILKDLK